MLSFLFPFFFIKINPDYGLSGVVIFSIPGITLYNIFLLVIPFFIISLVSKFRKITNNIFRFSGFFGGVLIFLNVTALFINTNKILLPLDINTIFIYFYLFSNFMLLSTIFLTKKPPIGKVVERA
jgi:hypothetical protein